MAGTEYHFAITLHWCSSRSSGISAYTTEGIYTAARRDTRQDAYRAIVDRTAAASGAVNPNVMMFSFEPNDL